MAAPDENTDALEGHDQAALRAELRYLLLLMRQTVDEVRGTLFEAYRLRKAPPRPAGHP